MPRQPVTGEGDAREERRLQAWKLHQQGWSQRRIARELGVSQSAVGQWIKRARLGGGVESLRRRPAPGCVAALTEEQRLQLPTLLACGAKVYGFRSERWTTRRVATLLQNKFGVLYHPTHVGRLLRKYYPDWRTSEKK